MRGRIKITRGTTSVGCILQPARLCPVSGAPGSSSGQMPFNEQLRSEFARI